MHKLLPWSYTCGLLLCLFLSQSSCTRMPLQSITLSEKIQEEGERMHRLNLLLVHQVFAEKKNRVKDFIQKEYTTKIVAKMTEDLDDETDPKSVLPEMMAAALPLITERQYAMQLALDSAKIKLLDQLNADFKQYQLATSEMKKLLESAVKLNESKKDLLNQSNWLNKKGINYDALSELLDRFIQSSGNIGGLVVNLNKDLEKILQ